MYELQVTLHSFSNPDGRCAGTGCDGCCEGGCPRTSCDYYLSYCQRPARSVVSYGSDNHQGNCDFEDSVPLRLSNQDRIFMDYVVDTMIFTGYIWVRLNDISPPPPCPPPRVGQYHYFSEPAKLTKCRIGLVHPTLFC